MNDGLRISGTIEESIVDGTGIRFVIFTQGCCHHCEGCHNPHTHDISGGYIADIDDLVSQVRKNPLIDGVTISGGEPFIQAKAVNCLVKRLKEFNYNIWVYSGYTLEELMKISEKDEDVNDLLFSIDTLIDGKFEKDKVDYTLKFRGSSNQRIINISEMKRNNGIKK